MTIDIVARCDRSLDFHPRRPWARVLPALAWKGLLLTGFERGEGPVLDLSDKCGFLEAMKTAHPELCLSELGRLHKCLRTHHPELAREFSEGLFAEYDLRWCERLEQTLDVLLQTPLGFQDWVDEKKVSPRELAPLLALTDVFAVTPFLRELPGANLSKSQAVQALEWVVELFLMGRPLNDLMPTEPGYLRRLEQWRKPLTGSSDETWREKVAAWPWPAQVQGQWQRFGDQSGLEIKIRTTSPQDLSKKLERLSSINSTWSCGR